MTTEQTTHSIDTSALYALTEAERLDARDIARANVIRRYGDRPQRADFEQHTDRQYPVYVTTIVTLVMVLLLVAAFIPSALRLWRIAHDTFAQTVTDSASKTAVGWAFILLAESGQIGFTLAAGVLAIERKSERRMLYAAALISTAIALVGNVQLALGHRWLTGTISDPFATLEAAAPPVLVILAATVLKHLMLDDIARKHSNERAYQIALAEWQALTAEPEESPHWQGVYASALKTKLIAVNASGRGKSEREAIMQSMTNADWRRLVWHEMQADQWFELPADSAQDAHSAAMQIAGGNYASPLSDTPSGAILQPVTALHSNGNGATNGKH